jgi:hypothetical protein
MRHVGLEATRNGVSDAVSHDGSTKLYSDLPADLQTIIHSWEKLPDTIRTAVLAVVRSASL